LNRPFYRLSCIRLAGRKGKPKSRRQPLDQRDFMSQLSDERTLPRLHGTRQMRRMLHAPPLTSIKQLHLMQPFVKRITERTVEVAIEQVGDHSRVLSS
jgi:hypothetical protein